MLLAAGSHAEVEASGGKSCGLGDTRGADEWWNNNGSTEACELYAVLLGQCDHPVLRAAIQQRVLHLAHRGSAIEGARRVPSGCLEGAIRVSGGCLEGVWRLCGT